MIDIHSKYDNMQENEILCVLIYINNHVIICINCMLSVTIFDQPPKSVTRFD